MRLTLQRKFFLALAVLLLALLLMFLGSSRYALQRGIGPYVAEIELSRLDWLISNIETKYGTEGNWDFLRRDPEAWRDLEVFDREHRRFRRGPPPADEPDHAAHPPWRGPQPDVLPSHFAPPPPANARRGPWADPDSVYNRLTLVSDDGHAVLAGHALTDASVRREINVHGRTVGYLALAPLQGLGSRADRAFVEQQSHFLLLTGAAGLLLAMLISALAARRWLQPVTRMAQAAQEIAQGRFEAAVPVTGSDELAQLARTFNHMSAALANVEQTRERWLADVAHELRTPVAALRAEIEALQDGVRQFDESTSHRLHRQVTRLGKLVEDLRLVMNPPMGDLPREEVEPLAILVEAAESMRPRLQNAQLSLDGMEQLYRLSEDASPRVRGDGTRLTQVFLNLLENSARYTHAGGRVLLHARVEAGKLRITIDDSAPGPAASDLPRLFERFYRAEASRSRATGGSGLGLAICRSIVHTHGGQISAHPSALGGLRVQLEFSGMAP